MLTLEIARLSGERDPVGVWLSSDEVGHEVLGLMLAAEGVEDVISFCSFSGSSTARGSTTEANSRNLAAVVVGRGGTVIGPNPKWMPSEKAEGVRWRCSA